MWRRPPLGAFRLGSSDVKTPLFSSVMAAEAHNARVRRSWRDQRLGGSVATDEQTVPVVVMPQPPPVRDGSFVLVLPWPPSDNTLYRPGGPQEKNQRYLTDEHKWFRQQVLWLVSSMRIKPLHGSLRASIAAFPPNDKCDIQNITKSLFDALQHAGCFANDRQIRHFSVDVVDGIERGSISVTVSEV